MRMGVEDGVEDGCRGWVSRVWSGVGARLPEVVDDQWRGGLLGLLQLARLG